jgi:hypothetical protein
MDRDVKAVTADFSGDPVSGVYKLSAINGSGLPAALYPTIQVESGEFRFLDEALWFGPNMSTRHGSVAFTLKGQELGPNGPRPYFSSDSGLGGYTIGEITSNPVPIPFVPNVVLPAGRVIYQWGSQAIPIATISGDTMTVYDRNSAAILTLSKQALIRSAHIDPASSPLNFPNTLQESTSPSRTITITNTGREPLAIQGLVSTTFALNFSVSKVTHAACDLHTILGVGATLPAGASCSIEVTFTPNLSYVTGLRTETITWRTNAGSTSGIVFRGTPVVLEGIATGVPRISVSPPSVTFPPTAIGSVSQQTIMVENVGDVPLRVLSPSSTKFGVDATGCRDRSLPAGGNCSIVLSYQPFFEFTGSLFIPTNSESTGGERFMNLTVPIVATNGRPVADAGPDQLDARVGEFVVVDGSASTDLEGHPLTYAWLVESAPAGSAALLFQTIPQVPTAQFFADRLGTYVLRLLVNDGAQDSLPDTVVVTVQPPPGVTVPSPLGLTFPATPPGSRTTAQTVQITNTGGRPVNITSVDVSGEFGLSSNTCATLSPQAECTLEVYFAPGGSGPRTGEIVILSDASNTVARVLLSGGVFINDPAPPRVTGLGELSLSGSWEVRFYSGDDDESSWFKVGNLPEFEWEEDDSPGRVVRIDFGTDEGVVRIADDNDGDDLRPLTLEPMADGRYLLHLHDDDPPNAIELTLVLQRTP